MEKSSAFSGVMTIAINALSKVKPLIGDSVAVLGGGLIGQLTAAASQYSGLDVDVLEIDKRVSERLTKQGHHCIPQLEKNYDHVIICTDTDSLFQQAQDHVNPYGNIVITGVGSLILNRDLMEAKQFRVFCTNSYGEFASNYYYDLLIQDNLAEQYQLNTARKNLMRAKYILEKQPFTDYTLLPIKDYKQIDPVLQSRDHASILLDWTIIESSNKI